VGVDQIKHRSIDRYAMANDASHYLLVPQAVAVAHDADDVGKLLKAAAASGVPLTFRSGGTSLSGQGVTDGILVDTRRSFRDVEVLDDGARVRVQPGVTVRQLNAHLAAFGRKFGPDPASESACTVGGVVANNSSGMACGTAHNAYQTLESMTLVLPSGTVIDTGAADADAHLKHAEPDLYHGLLRLRDRVRDNAASTAHVRRQFAMKNTMGYSLNALLDHDEAVDILAHLAVGSEGTLGFVAEATFRTIPVLSYAATGLLVFDSISAATRELPDLVGTGAATIELMDAESLRVGQGNPRAIDALKAIDVDQHAALLVEYQTATAEELADAEQSARSVLDALPQAVPASLTSDPDARSKLWHVRKGLYAAVAGARPSGTTALLEDIVVPVDALEPTCTELTKLFAQYHYTKNVIFGHAKDGNVHFMLTDRFEQPEPKDRYRRFTEDLVDLVLGHGGSLKAEHGTGRMMSPYVRRQYGDELYEVMREIKNLFDPRGLLSPGVILDDDPEAHLKHIKTTPQVEQEVDRCVECGYCEPVCPSRDLTTTPRQRIVLRRAMADAEARGDKALADELSAAYDYDAVQSCAADGMCQTACPVSINTGDLVKRLRRGDAGWAEQRAWGTAAKHWSGTTRAASAALSSAKHVPAPIVRGPNKVARATFGTETVPLWSSELPTGGKRRARPTPAANPVAVYLPACVGAMFGPAEGGVGVQAAFESLCGRAGIDVLVPDGIDSLCCGTPWSSKGLTRGHDIMAAKVQDSVREATRDGELAVVCDASSCTEGFRHVLDASVRVIDVVEFVAEHVVPRVSVPSKLASIALHPTCSSTQIGLNGPLRTIAQAVALEVHEPVSWACCAFAGDRGMLHPELTASATKAEADEVVAMDATAHASCNRTCELGMTRATGRPYRHILEVLAAALDAKQE
jgi:D-lactate dehydrogenase